MATLLAAGAGRRRCRARRSGSPRRCAWRAVAAVRALEQHVGRKRLRKRPGAVLAARTSPRSGQQRRQESGAVEPRLDHGSEHHHDWNLQSRGGSDSPPPRTCRHSPPGSSSSTTSSRSRSCSAYPLRKEGYEVVPATGRAGGARALPRPELRPDRARRDAPEARRLRRLPPDSRAAARVPIIMLTAKAEEFDKVLGLELGRRRLHHQAVLDARVPQPREGGAAARRPALARGAARARSRSRPRAAASTSPSAPSRSRGEPVRLTYVEFEILAILARNPGRVFSRTMLLDRALGRLRLPRPAHHRRPHPSPAREGRARPEGAGADLHGARRGVPLPRPMKLPLRSARSLRNKLALLFFAITAVAFSVVFFFVVPQLESQTSSSSSSTSCGGVGRGRRPRLQRGHRRQRGRRAEAVDELVRAIARQHGRRA